MAGQCRAQHSSVQAHCEVPGGAAQSRQQGGQPRVAERDAVEVEVLERGQRPLGEGGGEGRAKIKTQINTLSQKLLNIYAGSFDLVIALPITNFEAPILRASDASETLD